MKEIVSDVLFLSIPSKEADEHDLDIANELLDTLKGYHLECVGMAANMIGYSKRIIVFLNQENKRYEVMFNPVIVKTSGIAYKTMEGCLSLVGEREAKRYPQIKVQFQDEKMRIRLKSYKGFTAQIIQHEIDHCNGIII